MTIEEFKNKVQISLLMEKTGKSRAYGEATDYKLQVQAKYTYHFDSDEADLEAVVKDNLPINMGERYVIEINDAFMYEGPSAKPKYYLAFGVITKDINDPDYLQIKCNEQFSDISEATIFGLDLLKAFIIQMNYEKITFNLAVLGDGDINISQLEEQVNDAVSNFQSYSHDYLSKYQSGPYEAIREELEWLQDKIDARVQDMFAILNRINVLTEKIDPNSVVARRVSKLEDKLVQQLQEIEDDDYYER